MATLTKEFELDAGHRLSKHDFACQNLHGHRYQFEVTAEGDPDPATGMIVDFAHLKEPVMDAFDHNFILNEADPILAVREELEANQKRELYLMPSEPTAENIVEETLDIIVGSLTAGDTERIDRLEVTLFETPNSRVTGARQLKHG